MPSKVLSLFDITEHKDCLLLPLPISIFFRLSKGMKQSYLFLIHPKLYEQLGGLIFTPSCLFNYTIEHNYHGARFDTPILFWVGELGDPTSGRWQASISTHVTILKSGNINNQGVTLLHI